MSDPVRPGAAIGGSDTVSRVGFLDDLATLRADPDGVPVTTMRVRHERRSNGSASLVQAITGDKSTSDQLVALYDLSAVKGSKPIVTVNVSPSIDLGDVTQGSVIKVRGWPAPGRAVAFEVGDTVVEAIYPCSVPVFRVIRMC